MSIEHDILLFIQKNHSHRKFLLWGKVNPVSLETDLRKDLKIIYEDACDFFIYYFDNWKIELGDFNIDRYFSPEYLGSHSPEKPLEPITIGMLVESAKSGRWLY